MSTKRTRRFDLTTSESLGTSPILSKRAPSRTKTKRLRRGTPVQWVLTQLSPRPLLHIRIVSAWRAFTARTGKRSVLGLRLLELNAILSATFSDRVAVAVATDDYEEQRRLTGIHVCRDEEWDEQCLNWSVVFLLQRVVYLALAKERVLSDDASPTARAQSPRARRQPRPSRNPRRHASLPQ